MIPLSQLCSRAFVLMACDMSIEEARAVLDRTEHSTVVLADVEGRFFLLRREALRASLDLPAATGSVVERARHGLLITEPVVACDATADAELAPLRCVVIERGQVIGYCDSREHDWDKSLRGQEPGQSGLEPVDEAQDQIVLLAGAAPRTACPEAEFTVRFAAYLEEHQLEVAERFQDLGTREPAMNLGRCRWRPGTMVEVLAHGKWFEVEEPLQGFTWRGDWIMVEFDVTVRREAPRVPTVLKIDVLVDGIRVGRVRLDIDLSESAGEHAEAVATSRTATSAFASYASEDRERVLDRIATLRTSTGIDVFLDCLSLRPGDSWKTRLESEIRDRDVFLLFWSRHAARSPWVEWEWTQALSAKEERQVQVHPLDPVAQAPPPARLSHLHFADPLMELRAGQARPRDP